MSFKQGDYKGDELLILESVRGYKQWTWDSDRKLISMFPADWTNGSLTSTCSRYDLDMAKSSAIHVSPDISCTCGIYAHYLPLESYEKPKNIFGVVECSGKLLMGTRGFRAEKAKIVALAGYGPCTQFFETRKKTRGEYPEDVVDFCTSIGVPYFPTVKQMVYEFPQIDLTSLGVPSLDSWKKNRDADKYFYEKAEQEAKARLEQARDLEKEMYARYGVIPSDKPGSASYRMAETMRHLGGFK